MTLLVAAHTWAGGGLPSTGWMVAAAALVFAAGTMVLRGRVPLWAMVPALVVVQFLLHCWMVGAGSDVGPRARAAPRASPGRWSLAHVAGGLVTALVWELRRRAVEVVLTWSEVGLLPVPTLRRTVAPQAPVLPLRRPLVVVPLRGPPVGVGSAV